MLYTDISNNIYTELNTTNMQIGCVPSSNWSEKLYL